MDASDYIKIPASEEEWNIFPFGARVTENSQLNGVRNGTVTSWARAAYAHEIYRTTNNPEILIDNEGPVVTFDDGTVDWFPGQSVVVLSVLPPECDRT